MYNIWLNTFRVLWAEESVLRPDTLPHPAAPPHLAGEAALITANDEGQMLAPPPTPWHTGPRARSLQWWGTFFGP